MRNDIFEYMLPDIPDSITERMENDIKRCKEGHIKKKGVFQRQTFRVAAAVLTILLVGGTVYAQKHHVKKITTEKDGNYGVIVGVTDEGTTALSSDLSTEDKAESGLKTDAAEYRNLRIVFGMKPEGMEEYPNALGKLSDKTDNDRYFSPMLVHIDHDEKADFDKLRLGHVADESDVTVAGIPGKKVEFSDGRSWYYMLYEDENAVLVAMTGSGLSESDFETIISGLEIRATDQVLTAEDAYKWSDYVSDWNDSNLVTDAYRKDPLPAYEKTDLENLMDVGDTFDIPNSITQNGWGTKGLSVTLTDVSLHDDLSLLDEDMLSYNPDWLKSVGEDGKLLENTIYAYKAGDGIQTEDEVIDEVHVNQKLVYATVAFTNNSAEDMKDVWFYTDLCYLVEGQDDYRIYEAYDEYFRFSDLPEYAYARYEYAARDNGEMMYFDFADSDHNPKNYISEIPAGETRTVHVAYLVNEDTLPYLVMTVNNRGANSRWMRICDYAAWYDLRDVVTD